MLHLLRILIAVIGIAQASSVCSECQSNGVECISETQFRVCVDEGSPGVAVFQCPEGEICTALGVVCVPRLGGSVAPTCINQCNVCEIGKAIACTSRTTFALCSAGTVTKVVGTCPDPYICDTAGSQFCVKPCSVASITCDEDAKILTPSITSMLLPASVPI